MKILGISAHYHDSAAALVVDGVPVCAVQEERLSRRKNDAAFPLAAIEWCLDTAGIEPERARRGRLLRKADAEVRAHPDDARCAPFPRSWRSFPQAMKNALGEKAVGARASSPRSSACPPTRSSSPSITRRTRRRRSSPRRRAAPPSSPPTASASGRRSPSGAASATTAGATSHRAPARDPLPALARDALLDVHRLPGFAVNEGEYKVMGLAAYGSPRFADAVRKRRCAARRTARSRSTSTYFEFHTTREPLVLAQVRRRVRAAARSVRAHRSRDAGRAALRRHRGQRAARARGHAGRARARAAAGDGARGSLPRRRRGAERRARTRASCASRVSSASSCRPRRATPAARSARRCTRIACTSAGRDREVPDHPFWGPAVDAEELARVAREDGSLSRGAATKRRSSSASPASSRAAASWAGWRARPSSVRARSATAASSPRRTTRRCATG